MPIHAVQLLLILLLAVAVYWLTEGLTSTAARISRVALLPYLVFYSAFDAVVGLSNGLVVKYGSELPPAEQRVGEDRAGLREVPGVARVGGVVGDVGGWGGARTAVTQAAILRRQLTRACQVPVSGCIPNNPLPRLLRSVELSCLEKLPTGDPPGSSR